MAGVSGEWDCTVETPMGDQPFVFAIEGNGASFTGSLAGALGSLDVPEGTVDGNRLSWVMDIQKPMALRLNCSATIDGDALDGKVSAGIFGSFPMTGVRKG